MSRVYLGGKKHLTNCSDQSQHQNSQQTKILAFKADFDESIGSNKDLQHILSRLQMAAPSLVSKENTVSQIEVPSTVVISRKRKAWEGTTRVGSNKYIGSGRLPSTGRGLDDDEDKTRDKGLDTPVCSRTGFEDETGPEVENESGSGRNELEVGGGAGTSNHHKPGILSPMNAGLLNVDDIDADNLAADFDESFTGLGVDITTANYSMSEAMLSLNNICINNPQIKQESGGRYTCLKSDGEYMFSNYGALDLSNDEAQHASHDTDETSPPPPGPQTFSGSVTRENSMDQVKFSLVKHKNGGESTNIAGSTEPVKTTIFLTNESKEIKADIARACISAGERKCNEMSHSVFNPSKIEISSVVQSVPSYEDADSNFQYVLTAPTSIATKVGEPSLTYINQGQSYELKIKKLGDLSNHYKKKWLRSTIRICFHERRLQYIESEQIAEWARSHPNERILDIDMPLSYGIGDVRQEYDQLNQVSFSWDPTRETGVFIKVHCISTEFTPKKHGGERGVPFRLQVETWFNDARVHAAACILQVFKLKGADRKHKQDREKLQKRTTVEQEKYSQQYECTVLTDLSVDSIYIPPSRGISPVQSDNETMVPVKQQVSSQVKASSLPPSTSTSSKDVSSRVCWVTPTQPSDNKSWRRDLPTNAAADTTAGWLSYHRYSEHLKTFQNCDAQDLLRFTKLELIQIMGTIDGIRLFNDLHMAPVAPRLVIYVAQKEDDVFNPILLKDVTAAELAKSLASTFKICDKYTLKMIASGPNKIPVRMTDEYLRYQEAQSAFIVTFFYDESQEICTAHMEGVTFQQA